MKIRKGSFEKDARLMLMALILLIAFAALVATNDDAKWTAEEERAIVKEGVAMSNCWEKMWWYIVRRVDVVERPLALLRFVE